MPLVADMILRGQLARLEVFLVTDTSAGQQHLRYDAARLARGSPLAGMVGLLADPYLRCARMFIQARHGKEWCRFHVDECSSEGDDGVVEVDWGRMVRELDPGGREYFPVAKATGERTGV